MAGVSTALRAALAGPLKPRSCGQRLLVLCATIFILVGPSLFIASRGAGNGVSRSLLQLAGMPRLTTASFLSGGAEPAPSDNGSEAAAQAGGGAGGDAEFVRAAEAAIADALDREEAQLGGGGSGGEQTEPPQAQQHGTVSLPGKQAAGAEVLDGVEVEIRAAGVDGITPPGDAAAPVPQPAAGAEGGAAAAEAAEATAAKQEEAFGDADAAADDADELPAAGDAAAGEADEEPEAAGDSEPAATTQAKQPEAAGDSQPAAEEDDPADADIEAHHAEQPKAAGSGKAGTADEESEEEAGQEEEEAAGKGEAAEEEGEDTAAATDATGEEDEEEAALAQPAKKGAAAAEDEPAPAAKKQAGGGKTAAGETGKEKAKQPAGGDKKQRVAAAEEEEEEEAAEAAAAAGGKTGAKGDGDGGGKKAPAANEEQEAEEAEEEGEKTAAVGGKQGAKKGDGGGNKAPAADEEEEAEEEGEKTAAAGGKKAPASDEEEAEEGAAAAKHKGGKAAQLEEADEDVEEEEAEIVDGAAPSIDPEGPDTKQFPWWDTRLPVAQRVEALLSRLSSAQKIDQLMSASENGIPELEVPAFNWQEECLHGVKVGITGAERPAGATIYPITIAWAATFDDALAHAAASQIGDELRAQFNRRARAGALLSYSNCFGPHVHIVRDPRWGRMAETFGEDPLLRSNMAVAHVTGLQGDAGNATYLKAYATCKHFLGNDLEGWEGVTRHNFNNNMTERDLRDTFLPPFEACVREARAQAIMCSYNSLNGVPSCVNKPLLTDLLRGELGFEGMVVTDCTALTRIIKKAPAGPHYARGNKRAASALALQAGTDMACHWFDELHAKDVSREELDTAVRRVLTARVRQGQFNSLNTLPFGELGEETFGKQAHRQTAREIAAKGSVLLKNAQGALPLKPSQLKTVAVIGPFANHTTYILGKYFGATAGPITTLLQAVQAAVPQAKVLYSSATAWRYTQANVQTDIENCEAADVCLLFLGSRMSTKQSQWKSLVFDKGAYDTLIEGEGYDRTTLKLQAEQTKLWQALAKETTTPLVAVLNHGGPLDVSDMQGSPRIGAILTMWHPGQHGAAAVADILFGKAAPSGRLPVTWYQDSYTELSMADVRMRAEKGYPGRTYRYWKGEQPLYPFGYGLSYVDFKLSKPAVVADEGGGSAAAATASITVASPAGSMAADTAVLVFMEYLGPERDAGPEQRLTLPASGCSREESGSDLVRRLVGYARTRQLQGGDSQRLSFPLRLAGGSRSSWAGFGEDPAAPPCGSYALRFGEAQPLAVAIVLV